MNFQKLLLIIVVASPMHVALGIFDMSVSPKIGIRTRTLTFEECKKECAVGTCVNRGAAGWVCEAR